MCVVYVGGLDQGLEGWCYVCVSCESGISVYMAGSGICVLYLADTCASEVTQCSILLHLMDIHLLTCICLLQISQIQTRLFNVVGPGLVSTLPSFVRSSASHPGGPHGQLAKKKVPSTGVGRFDTICTAVCDHSDRSTACRLCHLEPCPSCASNVYLRTSE